MRNLQQILHDKELDLARVREEVKALRFVAPLLTEQKEVFDAAVEIPQSDAAMGNRWPLKVS